MNLKNQRRMAADLLGCGEHRVWIDPNRMEDVADAITREDVRSAIKSGLIRKAPVTGQSKARTRFQATQRAKGRRGGPGSRRGAQGARDPSKQRWMRKIRAQRRLLKELRDQGRLSPADYRTAYLRAKGGVYRSKAHLLQQLEAEGLLKEAEE